MRPRDPRRRDCRRHLPHQHPRDGRCRAASPSISSSSLDERAAPVPHRAARGCSPWCARPWRRAAGRAPALGRVSRTSRPTSAARSTSSSRPHRARCRVCSHIAAMVSVDDFADRRPRALADGEVARLGKPPCAGSTRPTCPTPGSAATSSRRRTRTLLCGDLFTQGGRRHAPRHEPTSWARARPCARAWTTTPTRRDASASSSASPPRRPDARLHARLGMEGRRARAASGACRPRREHGRRRRHPLKKEAP